MGNPAEKWHQVNFLSASYKCTTCDEIQGYHYSTLDPRRRWGLFNIPNTWGFSKKINPLTFANYNEKTTLYPCHCTEWTNTSTWSNEKVRKTFKKVIHITTGIFDICGYIPGVATLTGLIRAISSIAARHFINRGIKYKVITGHFKDETRYTYRGHIIRGVVEMIPVIGQLINFSLDLAYHSRWSGSAPKGIALS